MATRTIDFCTEPAGWSKKDYTGRENETATGDGRIYGFHDLETASCRINYHWPRASNGAPSYARIDFSARTTSEPDFSFGFEGGLDIGQFSWGTGNVGMGEPGAGDSFLVGPCAYVQITADDDVSPVNAPKFRGVFVNAAQTAFLTSWQAITPYVNTAEKSSVGPTTIRVYISGGTGYVSLADGTTASVALSGSFSGGWSRWESWHDGGGGGSSNEGGAGEGRQVANGYFTSLAVAGLAGPTVGFIGFGTF